MWKDCKHVSRWFKNSCLYQLVVKVSKCKRTAFQTSLTFQLTFQLFFLYKNVLSKSKLTNFDINILVLLRQNMLWAHNFIFFEHWDQYVHLEFSLYRIYWYNFTLQIQFLSQKDCCYMYEWISPGIELNLPLIILQVLYLKKPQVSKRNNYSWVTSDTFIFFK